MQIMLILLIPFAIIGIRLTLINSTLKNTSYEIASGNNLWKIAFDKGIYGEFSTYCILEKCGENRILCNTFLKNSAGRTTEIDLISINTSGIFVCESKNYSGWIFGDEKNKNWTQSLQKNLKNSFYNPILQNKGHIKAIDNFLKNEYSDKFLSYIIFSSRCELKKITVTTKNVRVLKLNEFSNQLNTDKLNHRNRLTIEQVDKIYYALKKHSLVSDDRKQRHIENMKSRVF